MLSTLVRLMHHAKIYTKTGDAGSSSLFNGERRLKTDSIFEALGATDELNAQIGLARAMCEERKRVGDLPERLEQVQHHLFDLGAHVATPQDATEARLRRTAFPDSYTALLETWIDAYDAGLPPLRNFILPSGGVEASALHVARSVCRRAERCLLPLLSAQQIYPHAYTYVNRLSDLLFVMARTAALRSGAQEVIYKKQHSLETSPSTSL